MMILGLVLWLQPVHGYDVRRELVSWDVESWANIQPGSIYHALRKLSDEELLEEVATEQVGARPARTTYRITAKGRAEFEDLLRKYWWNLSPSIDPFSAAWAFVPALPRAEAIAALRNRARSLEARAEMCRAALADLTGWMAAKPPHVAWQFELMVAKCEAEIAWCGRVVDRMEAGQGLHTGESSTEEMLEHWRAQKA